MLHPKNPKIDEQKETNSNEKTTTTTYAGESKWSSCCVKCGSCVSMCANIVVEVRVKRERDA